ncbi:TlpA family protein disulfide reductase [Oscillatoriales cyanobacterium LEGE 11467]|uniref:TlpA family protein disulfide reductase n=1 Tax=Zarconia navalis LEGE 11467 TaxID=1828826 RepID=A0A928Z934_9CYAN|nr:TlpA disulfide reductase family protein [Zarconia navalis]MBE9042190.1 TlpA family protein disulfide reductase [Zarconia navalis LEGE 11467]
MKFNRTHPLTLSFTLAAMVFLGACAADTASTSDAETTAEAPAATETETTAEAPAATEPAATETELTSLPLTNAATGESFTLADYSGQTVLVKPMATWCGKCKTNLQGVQAATTDMGEGDVAIVALSVEDSLPDADLANYASEEGFDFTFAVATPEMTRALDAKFGQTALNPSIGSRFIISPDGEISELTTGKVDPTALAATLETASN